MAKKNQNPTDPKIHNYTVSQARKSLGVDNHHARLMMLERDARAFKGAFHQVANELDELKRPWWKRLLGMGKKKKEDETT